MQAQTKVVPDAASRIACVTFLEGAQTRSLGGVVGQEARPLEIKTPS